MEHPQSRALPPHPPASAPVQPAPAPAPAPPAPAQNSLQSLQDSAVGARIAAAMAQHRRAHWELLLPLAGAFLCPPRRPAPLCPPPRPAPFCPPPRPVPLCPPPGPAPLCPPPRPAPLCPPPRPAPPHPSRSHPRLKVQQISPCTPLSCPGNKCRQTSTNASSGAEAVKTRETVKEPAKETLEEPARNGNRPAFNTSNPRPAPTATPHSRLEPAPVLAFHMGGQDSAAPSPCPRPAPTHALTTPLAYKKNVAPMTTASNSSELTSASLVGQQRSSQATLLALADNALLHKSKSDDVAWCTHTKVAMVDNQSLHKPKRDDVAWCTHSNVVLARSTGDLSVESTPVQSSSSSLTASQGMQDSPQLALPAPSLPAPSLAAPSLAAWHQQPSTDPETLLPGSNDEPAPCLGKGGRKNWAVVDRKERRLVCNRASAKRARTRKQERVEELEVLTVKLRAEQGELSRRMAEAQGEMKQQENDNGKLKEEVLRLRVVLQRAGLQSNSAENFLLTSTKSCRVEVQVGPSWKKALPRFKEKVEGGDVLWPNVFVEGHAQRVRMRCM